MKEFVILCQKCDLKILQFVLEVRFKDITVGVRSGI